MVDQVIFIHRKVTIQIECQKHQFYQYFPRFLCHLRAGYADREQLQPDIPALGKKPAPPNSLAGAGQKSSRSGGIGPPRP
jgi:hypothetical protein